MFGGVSDDLIRVSRGDENNVLCCSLMSGSQQDIGNHLLKEPSRAALRFFGRSAALASQLSRRRNATLLCLCRGRVLYGKTDIDANSPGAVPADIAAA